MADPTATVTFPCPRCGTDISEAAAIRRASRARSAATALHDHPIWQELADALDAAMTKHPSMNSPHEGFGVIYEEFIVELGAHVWADTGRSAEARKEAIQVAAMGLRYALDLCGRAALTPTTEEARDA